MKVNFVGNVCNYGYWFAKWCREYGIEAKVFIPEGIIARDHPLWEDKTLDPHNLPNWIKTFPHVPLRGILGSTVSLTQRLSEVLNCDVIHGFTALTESVVGYGHKVLYHSPGGLDWVPFPFRNPYKGNSGSNYLNIKRIVSSFAFRRMLAKVDKLLISQPYEIPFAIKLVERAKIAKLLIPFDCGTDIGPTKKTGCLRELRFFAPARQYWKIKGNDIILKAFAEIIRIYGNKASKMLMLAWGHDVEKSKQLAEKLNLTTHLQWKPVLKREELLREMALPGTVVVNQFIRPYPDLSDGLGGISRDAMSVGAPLITHLNVPDTLRMTETDPPILGVKLPTVEALVEKMAFSIDMGEGKLREIGAQSREWLRETHDYRKLIPRCIQLYRSI